MSFPSALEAAGLDRSDSKFLAVCQDFVQQQQSSSDDNAPPRVQRIPVDYTSCCGFYSFLRSQKDSTRKCRKRKADADPSSESQDGSVEKTKGRAAAIKSGPHYDGHLYFPDYNCLIEPSLQHPDVHGLQQATAATVNDNPNNNTTRSATSVSYSVVRPEDALRWCVNGVTAKVGSGGKEIANDRTTVSIEHPIYGTPMDLKVRVTILPYVGGSSERGVAAGDDGNQPADNAGDDHKSIQQSQVHMTKKVCHRERSQNKTHLWLMLSGTCALLCP